MKTFLFIFILLVAGFVNSIAQKERMQAAYIYQFTKLIEWCPANKSGDFVIGVIGNASIFKELNGLKGKVVANQTITVEEYASVLEMENCHIIFITNEKSSLVKEVNKKVRKNCTLVVTEKSDLTKSGASINFIEADGKILFEVNKTSIVNHLLLANNKLYAMAKKVYEQAD